MRIVADIVRQVIGRYPSARTCNAELVLRCWLADADHPLPCEAQDALRRLLPYARQLRSPESYRRERQRLTSSGGGRAA